HWSFRWAVGATTTSRLGCRASAHRAAVSAKVVLPAPGVATARKSFASDATKRSNAAFCHDLRRTVRVMCPRALGWGRRTIPAGPVGVWGGAGVAPTRRSPAIAVDAGVVRGQPVAKAAALG